MPKETKQQRRKNDPHMSPSLSSFSSKTKNKKIKNMRFEKMNQIELLNHDVQNDPADGSFCVVSVFFFMLCDSDSSCGTSNTNQNVTNK
jgi:hypothetical protein